MKSAKDLIDLARATVHSDAELARALGIHPPTLADFRSGKRAMTPEIVAALCDVLELPGEECREYVALAVIENPKNAGKAEMLRRALFACWVLGVGSLATHSNDAAQATGLPRKQAQDQATCTERYSPVTNGMHIVACAVTLARHLLRTLFSGSCGPTVART